jgi:hypothetical protein
LSGNRTFNRREAGELTFVVVFKQEGKSAETDAEYLNIRPISDQIIDLLTAIENKVATTQ